EAQRARLEAEASFRRAHAAVNEFCVRFSEDLRPAPGLQPLRQKLLRSAREYYQAFVAERGHDPALYRELADTHRRVAGITRAIAEQAAALESYREAVALYRQLHERHPDDLDLQRKFASTLMDVASLQDHRTGLATLDEALSAYERFLAANP